jgi:hypothetical protein
MPPAPRMPVHASHAAHNNARWCDAICRAHGVPGEFSDTLWLNRRRVPRLYPNAVTLAAAGKQTEQLELIHALVSEERVHRLTVKDSFAALDLAPLGFHVLFEATWLWRPPRSPETRKPANAILCTVVKDPPELARWEAAWNGPAPVDQPAHPERIFLPALLADRNIVFVAAYEDDRIVAGAVGNRTGDVVGVSNLFAPQKQTARYWTACLTAIMDAFPGRPLVGYERGAELEVAHRVGFEDVGPLRVWTNAQPSA